MFLLFSPEEKLPNYSKQNKIKQQKNKISQCNMILNLKGEGKLFIVSFLFVGGGTSQVL